jgi:hypothetical protein
MEKNEQVKGDWDSHSHCAMPARMQEIRTRNYIVVNPDFSGKIPHFSAKHKIFLLRVKDSERAFFARIQLGRSWARYPGRPRAFLGEPHVDVT